MTPEGRFLPGLDEFMLRIGYWGIACDIASGNQSGGTRFVRALTKVLGRSVEVPHAFEHEMAAYLYHKHMSAVRDGEKERPARSGARYSHLCVDLTEGLGKARILLSATDRRGEAPTVWFQDMQLARPEIPSPLGAVTFDTRRATSKSGVSHILDWIRMEGLLRRGLTVTALGHVVAESSRLARNPSGPEISERSRFDLSLEAPLLSYVLFSRDGDILLRVMERASAAELIDRRGAIEIYAHAVRSLGQEMRGHAGSRPVVAMRRNVRREQAELWTENGRTGDQIVRSSTAKHRAIPRFEHLTDLGIFHRPGEAISAERFSYLYHPSQRGRTILEHIKERGGIGNWLMRGVFRSFGTADHVPIPAEEHRERLLQIVRCDRLLQRPIAATETIPLSLLACQFIYADGKLAEVNDMLETLRWASRKFPKLVRLARGRTREVPQGVRLNQQALLAELD